MYELPPKDELRRLYLDEKVSVRRLCVRYGVAKDTVRRWLVVYEIPLRSQQQASKVRISRKAPPLDKALLERMYVRQGRTMTEIARALKVGTLRVKRSLEHHEIPIQKTGGRRFTYLPPHVLKAMARSQLPLTQMARTLGVGEKRIREELDKLNVDRRRRAANGEGPPRRSVVRFDEVVVAKTMTGREVTRLVARLECGHQSPVARKRLPHDRMTATFGCKVCAQKEITHG
jgi:transposase-like protein